MFVSKINNTSFKGFRHTINDVGADVYKFNYPYDYTSKNLKIEFYKSDAKAGDKPVQTIDLKDTNTVNFDNIPEFNKGEAVKYKILLDGRYVRDTGYVDPDGFNVIRTKGTHPSVQGSAVMSMADIERAGAKYYDYKSDKTGEIYDDIEEQVASEKTIRTVSNAGGGTLAGVESNIDIYKDFTKLLFMPTIWGADKRTGHHYQIVNDYQLAVGNLENFKTFIRKLFKNGMLYIDDFAATSKGVEGIDTVGSGEDELVLGIVPKNKQNLRWRVVNPPVVYNEQTKSIQNNPAYNPSKGTIFQVYDASQATEEQVADTTKVMGYYENTSSENKLLINNSNDTVINYARPIKPQEYISRLKAFIEMNKNSANPIKLNSPEGALFMGQFSNFKIGTSSEGAEFWDGCKDLFKRKYYLSGADEKRLNAIPNIDERNNKREELLRECYGTQDNAILAAVYRTGVVKDTQMMYIAQAIGAAKSKEELDSLIGKLLPEEARLSDTTIKSIVGDNCYYPLEDKLCDSKEDVLLRALMKLPLASLEVGANTSQLLASPYFSKHAAMEKDIGLSRFEFYQNGAGVYAPYHETYHAMDNLFKDKIMDFASEVIDKINSKSAEKLLDSNGDFTEYGEYVINMIGQDIARYAFLKALAGDKLHAKNLNDNVLKGEITYDREELEENTNLEAYGIKSAITKEEVVKLENAKTLLNVISKGLDTLKQEDIDYLADSISKQIEGTTTTGFRFAEVMYKHSGLGSGIRLDAYKDFGNPDAVRNGDMTFDMFMDQLIDFGKKFVKEIKKVNPNAHFYPEWTDIDALMHAQYGPDTDVWGGDLSKLGGKYKNVPDAMRIFYEETGMTSCPEWDVTFTTLLRVFSADGESGIRSDNGMYALKDSLRNLLNSHDIEYIRNLWTFADNHDKPSVLHVMALDMELFHTKKLEADFNRDLANDADEIRKRNARIAVMQELTNSDCFENMPLEAMMNIDNKNYFMTANTRSTAMSQLIRSAINDRLSDDFDKKQLLKEALADLTDGKYLTKDSRFNAQTINIPELQTLEGALNSILSKAEMTLDDRTKQEIIRRAKERNRIEKFAVRGDFDWNGWAGKEIQDRAKAVLNNEEWDYMKYSPYTVSVAALLLESYQEVTNNSNVETFTNGTREFVHAFDRKTVNENSSALPMRDDNESIMRKNAYAARDVENVIEMMIQRAELKSDTQFTQAEKDHIMKEVFESATEPAVEKALMYMAWLVALPGIPTAFARDLLGALGFDEKAKNIFLQNRNTMKWSEIELEGPLKEYRTKILKAFENVMKIRNEKGMEALNSGTPYVLETNNPNLLAILHQGDGNDAVITILNNYGIDTRSRHEYSRDIVEDPKNAVNTINNDNKFVPVQWNYEIDSISLGNDLSLPEGTLFINRIGKDAVEYITKMIDGVCKLVRKDGQKIVMNGETAKYGAMFLKQAGRVAFKGRNINKQYNIISNPYKKVEKQNVGENLSIIAG